MAQSHFKAEADYVAYALWLSDTGAYACADEVVDRLYKDYPWDTANWFGAFLYDWINRRCMNARVSALRSAAALAL